MIFRTRLALVGLIVTVMFILHNSFWLWHLDDRLPLLFGFMPFAFSYYAGYALLSVFALRLIMALAWPEPPPGLFESAGEERPVDR